MKRKRLMGGLLAALVTAGCVEVPAGGQGVIFKRFSGGTQDTVFHEGLHIVPPWNYMVVYDIRRQDRQEAMDILTSNGLDVRIELSIRYRPQSANLPRLHQTVGVRYYDVIIKPIVRSTVRETVGQYTPEEIYSTKRDEIQKAIFDGVLGAVEGKHVEIEAVLIRNITLPDKLRTAISEKLEEEQRSEKMQFTLQREEQEADRKRIEAQGIADFQNIVSKGLNQELLQWKGIEATEKLSESDNAKVVVIGSGEGGLPLILGGN
ncbi:MAG: prohibitin family protein [Proteobacteria bacterium]|nr:prohibitin family protein [Pseudomonadota bacterium]